MLSAELEYFLMTATEGSFARAAEKLGISQPALTKAMQRLEKRLDVKLFARGPRGSELTEAGQAFQRNVAQLSRTIEGAIDEARDLGSGHAGRLRLGVTPAVADFVINALFPRLLDERPAAQISLAVSYGDVLLRGLQQREHSLVVCPTPLELPSDVIEEHLHTDDFLLAVRRDHPLTQLAQPRLADAVAWRWAVSTRHEVGRLAVEQAMRNAGLQLPTAPVQADSTGTLLGIVARTDLVSGITASMLRYGEVPSSIAVIAVPELRGIRTVSLLVRKGYLPAVAQRAGEILREAAAAFAAERAAKA